MMLESIRGYQVLSKLGEGGMGTVYLAEDAMLGRRVALKVLSPVLAQDSNLVDRFKQEAKVHSTLVHHNIVSVFTFFHESDTYCMVMEYAEGETLKHMIERIGPIPDERAINIFTQVLDGVGHAHAKGIIHRDLKPGNIMIMEHDVAKVMDFGIAKILGDKGMTQTGSKLGTVYYMSPEQITAAKDIDHRTDIYSLGITLYEMLAGRLPFEGETESDFEVMKQIMREELPDPRQFYPGIQDHIVAALRKSTEKDRNKRFHSTREFGAGLRKQDAWPIPGREAEVEKIPAEVSQPDGSIRSVTPIPENGGRKRRGGTWIAITCILLLAVAALVLGVPYFKENGQWNDAVKQNTPGSYQQYLDAYPRGKYADRARQQIEWFAWRWAQSQNSENGYRGYLRQFPQGANASAASSRLKALESERLAEERRKRDAAASAQTEKRESDFYAVVRVDDNDVLYVRESPDPNSMSVGSIPPHATCVRFLGNSSQYGNYVWYLVEFGNIRGWVNSRYLARRSC